MLPPDLFALLEASFFDGEGAEVQPALVRIAGDDLTIDPDAGPRVVWPLAELREVRGTQPKTEMILRRAGGAPARLILRDRIEAAWLAGEIADKQAPPDRGLLPKLRRALPMLRRRDPIANKGRLFGFGIGALASVALIIFGLVPLLATQLAALMSPEAERALGRATLEQIRGLFSERETPLQFCDSRKGTAALQKLFDRVSGGADLPQGIDLYVLETPIVNAVALPGGQVVILEGLITAAETPEELAAVLAHELGHVAGRDPTREALRSAGSVGVLGLIFGDFAGGGMALMLMNSLVNADYSQEAEARADAFAYDLLARNDIAPAALASLFRRLESGASAGGKILAHFASHPEMGDRIAAAENAPQPDNPRPILSDNEWGALRWICGW